MLALGAWLGLCTPAAAQFGGSVAIDSDYRFRGVTLSDGRPDARVSLAYDGASGWYAGALLTRVVFEPDHQHAAVFGYVGYARALGAGLAWEIGATRAAFAGDARYGYSEAYLGLIDERWTARLYLAGDYFDSDVRTAYLEADANWPLGPALRLLVHVGALNSLSGQLSDGMTRLRTDARFGVRWRIDDAFGAQLAWSGSSTGGPYPSTYERSRSKVVVGVSYAF